MKATSIHLKACDIGSAEAHNKREKELDYIRKDLSELNESFSYTDKSLPAIEAEIRREVKAKTGRKLQKNAIPIKEGVIVIDENTTLRDLQNFCKECRDKFGMIPLSIDIHRDEGYMNSKDWKRNLHAHIIWRMYDENGRNVRLSKQDMSDMQTMAAQHLHMARGKSSEKKHLSSIQYKIQAETERLQSIEKAIDEAENQLITAGFWNKKTKRELAETRNALAMANNTIAEQAETIENLERDNNARNDTNTRLLDKLNKQTEDIKNIDAIRAESNKAKKDLAVKSAELKRDLDRQVNELKREYESKETNLRNKENTLKKEFDRKVEELKREYKSKEIHLKYKETILNEKETKIKDQEKEAEDFYKDAEELGLSCKQANQLKREGSLTLPSITLPDGTTIQRKDPQNPNITLRYGDYAPDDKGAKTRKGIHINLHWHRDWKSVKTWIRETLQSAWYIINGQAKDLRQSFKIPR